MKDKYGHVVISAVCRTFVILNLSNIEPCLPIGSQIGYWANPLGVGARKKGEHLIIQPLCQSVENAARGRKITAEGSQTVKAGAPKSPCITMSLQL